MSPAADVPDHPQPAHRADHRGGAAGPDRATADGPDAGTVTALVALAERVAREAGRLVSEGRPDRVDVAGTKSSPTDVVTEMDLASEALLRAAIARARPDDGILGEEGDPLTGSSGVTWVLDPIDGTVNYLYGIPAYAVSVAAVTGPPDPARWTVVAACVHSVPDGRTWTAGLGQGAWQDGQRLHLAPARPLAESLVGTGFGYRVERKRSQARVVAELLPRFRDIRRIGSAAMDLCGLASRTLDLYYERGLQPWDLAAASLVAQEAGAVVVGLRGGPAGEAMTVAGPAEAVAELVALLEGLDADTDDDA